MNQRRSLRRALAVSVLAHAVGAVIGWLAISHVRSHDTELVDIEIAPAPPPVEALPAEVARPPQEDLAGGAPPAGAPPVEDPALDPASPIPSPPREAMLDAGIDAVPADAPLDAPRDARPDAALDARRDAALDARPDAAIDAPPDAAIDAPPDAAIDAPIDAPIDARPDAELDVATADAHPADDAAPIAAADAHLADGAPRIAAADAAQLDGALRIAAADAAQLDGAPRIAAADAAQLDGALRIAAADAHPADAPRIATADAAPPDSPVRVAIADAGALDAPQLAAAGSGADGRAAGSASSDIAAGSDVAASAGSNAGSGAGSAVADRSPGSGAPLAPGGTAGDPGALGMQAGSGSGIPGATDEPGVEGAPTTAGTAANLLAYFPKGHVVTALIRFDRLRGTEWADATERLLRPMPDYQLLFGGAAPGASRTKLAETLDTLVISTPRPRDAAATTLVGHTHLERAALRDFLSAQPVKWSAARGGLLGVRSGKRFPGDQRVFLSPFKGWFLLAPPDDLPGLTAPTRGDVDAVEASGKLPAWLAGIRKIESESGGPRGPALVVTIQLDTKRLELGDDDFGLGVSSSPLPDRASLAVELVKRGWLVRGNLRFGTPAAAAEFVSAVQRVQQRIADSHAIQMVVGKAVVRVVGNLSFARTGPRVSYATSISIADARAVLAAAAAQLDAYYGRTP